MSSTKMKTKGQQLKWLKKEYEKLTKEKEQAIKEGKSTNYMHYVLVEISEAASKIKELECDIGENGSQHDPFIM